MKKITKILTCGLIISSIAPAAYAKDSSCNYGNKFTANPNINKIVMNAIANGCSNSQLEELKNYLNCFDGSFNFDPNCNTGETPIPPAADIPTDVPTEVPTDEPTDTPTDVPTEKPIVPPADTPTEKPTEEPTENPSETQPPQSQNASETELKVLALVNEERAKNGLNALTWADDLANVAREHSKDMIKNNYFSHTDLNGNSPFDRLRNNGITYTTAAENIAYGQRTAEEVMKSWMNSSGHRANILNSRVKELGVGAATSSSGTIYWTQMFAAR